MPLEVESYALTDIGKVRKNNEDYLLHLPKHFFFTIADGMGGHKAGEIAAKEATHDFFTSFMGRIRKEKELSHEQIRSLLSEAIKESNQYVFKLANENPALSGMGTTLSCLYLHDKLAHFAHVGDSRIYHFRNQKLSQLTKDHSVIKAKTTPLMPTSNMHAITKAIGVSNKLTPEINAVSMIEQDIFLLCSDGLTDFVKDAEIERILSVKTEQLHEAAQALINQAKINASHDNITLILLKIHQLP